MKRHASTAAIMVVILVAAAAALTAQDTAQSLYLKASQLIRDGDFVDARVLLERILGEFPTAEIALKADERLTEILDRAKAQARERTYQSGPGLYVLWKTGNAEALPAFKLTNNNLAAESGDTKDGFIRSLSERTPYYQLVLTDVDKLVLFTPTQDMKVFRLERVSSWFPYHRAEDLAPLDFAKMDEEVYSLDLAQFDKVPIDQDMYNAGSGMRRCAVSAPPGLGFEATFLSQHTGTWGKKPGPVIRTVWPMDILVDYREFLILGNDGRQQDGLSFAKALLESHPDDPSIDLYITERHAESGDLPSYIDAADRYLQKARELDDSAQLSLALSAVERGRAAAALRKYVALGDSLSWDPGLYDELTRYADTFRSHVAYYLLSRLSLRHAEYEEAERLAKKAEDTTKSDCPLIWYCGLIDTAGRSLKNAQKAARAIYKANREEIKALRRQHE